MADDARSQQHTRRGPRRRNRARCILPALLLALALVASLGSLPANAQAAPDPVADADATIAQLRAQADSLATSYFAAVGHLAEIQQRADDIEARIPQLTAETDRLRALTQDRAIIAYKRSGNDLGSVIGAGDPLTAARRAQWLDRLNQRDDVVAADLRDATARLADQRATLRAARDDVVAALDQVKAQGKAIDELLTGAEERRQAAVIAASPPTTVAAAIIIPTGGGSTSVTPTTTTTTAPTAPKATPPPPPPSYTPTPGAHPHHDDPFLTCTRVRESSGNYAAYNPAGPYMGAYQFLQATWNSAANHAGRSELIGVPPSTASQYDQDDVAWSLYQWQGSRPWGSLCDDI